MGQIRTGKFISTGEAINLDLGFIPAWARFINASAAVNEVMVLEYWNQCGDAQEFWKYPINDQGSTTAVDFIKKSSGGYLSEYDTVSATGKQMVLTFDYTGGAAEDLLTCTTASQVPHNGQSVKFVESGGLPTGLGERLNYYVIDSGTYGAGTFRISLTPGGSRVEFTSDGTPTNYFVNISEAEPGITGGKGLTISADFSDDSDVIYFIAIEADRDQNLGDSASW